jgi:hypothetical protein
MSFKELLIKTSNSVILWSSVIFFSIALIYLILMSILKRDLKFPSSHPYLFIFESLIVSLSMGLLYILMTYGRSKFNLAVIYEFILNVIVFLILHLLLQFSGFYSYLF